MLEISGRDFFSKQYLWLLFAVTFIMFGLYPAGMKFEFEFNIVKGNKLRDCWYAEWFVQNMIMPIMFTALTGLVILSHVRDLES